MKGSSRGIADQASEVVIEASVDGLEPRRARGYSERVNRTGGGAATAEEGELNRRIVTPGRLRG
jgi:hypothetical protein